MESEEPEPAMNDINQHTRASIPRAGKMKRFGKRLFKTAMSPTKTIILGFLVVILIGGLLLMLPVSSADGAFADPIDALFTATSATCVTGLIVRDTATEWSMFGKGVILALIQIGGLGFMSMAMLVSALIKRTVTPRERVIFAQSMNLSAYDRLFRFLHNMVAFTFAFEFAGALLLSFRFIPMFGFWEGLTKSVFHSVSAFCNAGFDTMGFFSGPYSSLTAFSGDAYVSIIIALLIICGGLGFVVWQNIGRRIREGQRLNVYSRLVLLISGLLLVLGTVVIAAAEWNNPQTLGPMSVPDKLLCSFFQSVTFRTAGFNTIDLGAMTGMSKAASMLLMFIGGSSGSTAGGIKTVTFGLLVIAAFRVARGSKDVVVMKRRVDTGMLLRALSITVISLMVICLGAFLIALVDGLTFEDVLFETFSAFGTVGVTTGITTQFSYFGKLLLMAMMFFGRVGILTITYEIMGGLHGEKDPLRRPKAELLIG
ncbi:MAG: Trk family potassium uptake protein [Clostridiales bacterium]|nr:MAG: Trk family potassium uptake protein [Clostridiales bacterium]